MKLRWSTVLALVGLLALMLPAGLALADGSHDDAQIVTDPHTECVIDGSVELTPGVTADPTPGHYDFRDTTLECAALDGGAKGVDGVYDVAASGDTAGLLSDAKAGETCEDGHWDEHDIDGDGDTEGSLTATRVSGSGPASFSGTVKFHRLGSVVTAWGQLTDDTGKEYRWSGEFQFTPTEGDCPSGITEASLIGTASVANK